MTKEIKKNRKSNIELLRIIAILIVILSHFNVFSNFGNYNEKVNLINYILKSFFSIGVVANSIFLIITGYFLVKSEDEEKNYKKIIKLSLEMIFYSYTIALFANMFDIHTLNKKEIIESLLPNIFGNWFLVYYIVLLLFVPYINKFIRILEKKDLKKIIIIMFILYSVLETISIKKLGFSKHELFILFYFIGAYIKLYADKMTFNNKRLYIILMMLTVFLLLTTISVTIFGIKLNNSSIIDKNTYLITNNCSPITICISIIMFLIFKNVEIRSNRAINYISSSVLGVYLIHENRLIRDYIWNVFLPSNNQYYGNTIIFIGHSILKILIIFTLCLAIDKIRILLFDKIENNITDKTYNFFKKIFNNFIIK